MTGHIQLQSSIGGFDESFRKRLPAVEQAMREHGVDPAAFIIAKDAAGLTRLPIFYRPDGHPTEYTVFVKGRSFTVTQPNDLAFLEYFYALASRTNTKTNRIRSRTRCMTAKRSCRR